MTERDRLRDDLAETLTNTPLGNGPADFWNYAADRLIALGWTITPDGTPVELMPLDGDSIHRLLNDLGHFDNRCPNLDEERLARALRKHTGPGYFPGTADVTFIVNDTRDPAAEFAAAIAKAYREDTDATG